MNRRRHNLSLLLPLLLLSEPAIASEQHPSITRQIRNSLREKGWAHVPGFLSSEEVRQVRAWASELPSLEGALHHYERTEAGQVHPARTEDRKSVV